MVFRFWLIGCLLFVPTLVLGQTPVFNATHYNSENVGLSHNTVLHMMQDSRGFIWVSTMDGLNRFDGKSMKVFRHNPVDSTTLSDSFIHGVYETEDELLWIATRDGGLNILDPKTEKITRVTHSPDKQFSVPNTPVNVTYEDSHGFLWVGFFTGSLGYYDYKNDEYLPMTLITTGSGEFVDSIYSILELKDGSFLCSSLSGIYYISGSEIRKFRNAPKDAESILGTRIPSSTEDATPNTSNVHVDSESNIWVEYVGVSFGKIDSDLLTNEVQESIQSGVYNTSHPNNILERESAIVRGGNPGMVSFIDKETSNIRFASITSDVPDLGVALFKDREENIWGYTWGSGFYFLEERKGIETFTQVDGLPSDFMLGFADEGDDTWVATNAGLALLQNGEIISYRGKIRGYTDDSIWSVERDELGLWLTTRHDGVFFISQESIETGNLSARQFTTRNSLILDDNTHQVFRDSRGWLWFAYQGEGIQIVKNPTAWINGQLAEVQLLNKDVSELRINSNSIRRVYEDNDGNIWVATTDNGFNYLSFTNENITGISFFGPNEEAERLLSHRDGRNVLQQNESTFWFASYGGGITRWDAYADELLNLRTNDGLANNSTYGILQDENPRYIWVSTNNGLSKLDTETFQFHTYTIEDGIQNNEFNTGAYFKKENGKLVFGGVGGFSVIDTEALTTNQEAPPVYFTQINLFNTPIEDDTSAIYQRSLSLKHSQNFLSFEFAALDYQGPELIEYAYKMEGVDEDWVFSGNRNFADYPNLTPGEYSFLVKATNSNGIWGEEPISLAVIIAPPWWQTLWFRLISGFLIIAGFAGTIRYFAQRQLKEQIRKMELENRLRNERERISRDLHDHVGAQLANIKSGLTLVDKYNQVDQKDKSLSLMKSLQGDAEVTIKQLRETIWALNQNELNIGEFANYLRKYFNTQSALTTELELDIKTEGEEKRRLSSTQALNLFRIVQEASQNTLKYARARHLWICLCQNNGSLTLKVKDDGTFLNKEAGFNGGYGVSNMQKRAKEISGDFTMNTEEGTEIRVTIPLD